MTRKQKLLKLAGLALRVYMPVYKTGHSNIFTTREFWLWINDNYGAASEARCLYFCLLAAMEEE